MPESPNRFDHIAFGVQSVASVVPLLVGELGGSEREAGPGGGFLWWQWEFAGGALEILQPAGPPGGFLHRFLDARGAGPHHVTFKVPDIRASIERANSLGYDVVGFDDSQASWLEAFLHPKQAQGIVVQFAESHPELEGGSDYGEWPFPALPETRPETARCVGIRLACREEARAQKQWESLLGGTPSKNGNTLTYRWPESPLRISVVIDPTLTEGPLALEFTAPRTLALPTGPHPLLGLPVVQIKESLS